MCLSLQFYLAMFWLHSLLWRAQFLGQHREEKTSAFGWDFCFPSPHQRTPWLKLVQFRVLFTFSPLLLLPSWVSKALPLLSLKHSVFSYSDSPPGHVRPASCPPDYLQRTRISISKTKYYIFTSVSDRCLWVVVTWQLFSDPFSFSVQSVHESWRLSSAIKLFPSIWKPLGPVPSTTSK